MSATTLLWNVVMTKKHCCGVKGYTVSSRQSWQYEKKEEKVEEKREEDATKRKAEEGKPEEASPEKAAKVAETEKKKEEAKAWTTPQNRSQRTSKENIR